MWSLFIVVLVCAQSCQAVVLDRNQLASWYPNYLTSTSFDLDSRQPTSTSADTLTDLGSIKRMAARF